MCDRKALRRQGDDDVAQQALETSSGPEMRMMSCYSVFVPSLSLPCTGTTPNSRARRPWLCLCLSNTTNGCVDSGRSVKVCVSSLCAYIGPLMHVCVGAGTPVVRRRIAARTSGLIARAIPATNCSSARYPGNHRCTHIDAHDHHHPGVTLPHTQAPSLNSAPPA